MAYYGSKPVKVADGGTGAITLTDHGVMLGQATSAVVATSAGSDGLLLLGNTGADPSFGNTSDGSFTFSSTTAGTPRVVAAESTDNTNPASSAGHVCSVGGASAGPTRYQFVISGGSNNWAMGIDNATTSPEADPLTLVTGTTPGSLNKVVYRKSGVVNFPNTTAFLAFLPTQVNNVTGNGGVYTLGVSGITALTKVFDQNTNITTGGVFTAPITGKYDVRVVIRVIAAASSKVFTINLITSNRTYQFIHNDTSLSGPESISVEAICDFDAADTATATCVVTGEVGDIDGIAGSSTLITYICGRLVA